MHNVFLSPDTATWMSEIPRSPDKISFKFFGHQKDNKLDLVGLHLVNCRKTDCFVHAIVCAKCICISTISVM